MTGSTEGPEQDGLEEIGERIRRLRERRGWSREALAYHSGRSWAAIEQIETGRRRDPRISTLMALAGALDVKVEDLLPRNYKRRFRPRRKKGAGEAAEA